MAIVTVGITLPEHARVAAAHHPFAVCREITTHPAIDALVITHQAGAAEVPAVRLLVPVSGLTLIPLIALRAAPLPAIVFIVPMPALPLIPLIGQDLGGASVMLLMHRVLIVLGDLVAGLVGRPSGALERNRSGEPARHREHPDGHYSLCLHTILQPTFVGARAEPTDYGEKIVAARPKSSMETM